MDVQGGRGLKSGTVLAFVRRDRGLKWKGSIKQWRILILRSGPTEGIYWVRITPTLDLTSGSGFATAIKAPRLETEFIWYWNRRNLI